MLKNTDIRISAKHFKGGNVGGITVVVTWHVTHMLDMQALKEYTII